MQGLASLFFRGFVSHIFSKLRDCAALFLSTDYSLIISHSRSSRFFTFRFLNEEDFVRVKILWNFLSYFGVWGAKKGRLPE